ncbi:type IV pilus biogenesis protein PilM [Natranaerobius thermophilus]|uniref:Tfp pilus assembly protein ATPase PilM-like protein n=1 Tax=Natranaerobius thermophilus (strain ATCC BAA-1301 / DSM 18059 / JW/NM-WN-LF) TaxID=457570 RepID=B2A558_NATTJ|nr:pilus assembly protein PilM [Natranaerobius thermophilus]ACB85300.1 Tfp pilus assembly protein ATPase PilM-like protein [Natranaerobius thermophilus JW/NM-WN-LF]
MTYSKAFGLFDQNAIGVNFDSHGLKIVQLGKRGNKIICKKIEDINIQDQGNQDTVDFLQSRIDRLREYFVANSLTKKQIYFAIKSKDIIIKTIQLPNMSKKDIDSAIKLRIETQLILPWDNVVVDWFILNRSETNTKVLIVAAQKEQINDYCRVFKDAGLIISALEVDVFSILRMVNYTYSNDLTTESQQINIIVNINTNYVSLIFLEENKYILCRNVNLINFDIQNQLTWEKIILEIESSLNYINFEGLSSGNPRTLFLTGDCHQFIEKHVINTEVINNNLVLKHQLINPFQKIDVVNLNSSVLQDKVSYCVATGLALRRWL